MKNHQASKNPAAKLKAGKKARVKKGKEDVFPIDVPENPVRNEMKGFRPGPGNTGSMDGKDETGRRQVGHKI